MSTDELFWNSSVNDMKKGYTYESSRDSLVCLICGAEFEQGVIYPIDRNYYEAEKAAKYHVNREHGPMFNYLINLNKKYTGLTEVQQELLGYFYQGLSDKEIVERQGGGSTSTIRNHRFKMKEKEKQAKVYLAISELLWEEKTGEKEFVNIHKGATMVDDRYAITQQEREKILKTYFENGRLKNLPSKEKRKIIIFQEIIQKFQTGLKYNETQVNNVIEEIFDDYVTIRRYLIEYGFMERSKDCSEYWVKN